MQQHSNLMRQGFTFLEIIVVIAVIGLIYSLGISSFTLPKPKAKPLSPLNLKETIVRKEGFSGTFMCTDKCKKCYMRTGLSTEFSPYSNPIKLTGTVPYMLTKKNSLEEIEYGKYKEENVCLVMEFYKNGSSTQLVLENKSGAFFLPAYFGEAKKFASTSEAEEHWKKDNELISDSGAFY